MKSLKLVSAALVLSAFAWSADARANLGGTLQCRDTATGPVVWSYVIKKTKSNRLASDITYFKNGVGQVISSFNVAQYSAWNKALFMIVDDNLENTALWFNANIDSLSGFYGNLREVVNGSVVSNRRLRCKIVP